MCVGKCFHAPLNFRKVFGIVEVNSAQAQRSVEEVVVAVGKAGQYEPAAGVDHFGGGPAERVDVVDTSDGEYLFATDGNTLRPGLVSVYGVNASVHDHDVSSGRSRLRE
jgi:hypothetical protein